MKLVWYCDAWNRCIWMKVIWVRPIEVGWANKIWVIDAKGLVESLVGEIRPG